MVWTNSDRVVSFRQRSWLIDLIVEMLDGWRRHLTSRNAAVLTYYGFLSVFPLFMVSSTILALVLRGNERLREEILDTAIAQFPVIGSEIQRQAGSLSGDWPALIIGLLIALWASTRAFAGIQTTSDDVWEVHVDVRDNTAVKRAKGLIGIAILGAGMIGATAVSSIASVAVIGLEQRLLLFLGSMAINTAMIASIMRVLTTKDVTWSMIWPGAIAAGIGFVLLQGLGATIVTRFLASASDTAGTFAIVFALMAWINLHALASLAGLELNAARHRIGSRDSVGHVEDVEDSDADG